MTVALVHADTLILPGNERLTATVLQTNTTDVLVLTDHGTAVYPLAEIEDIEIDSEPRQKAPSSDRIPRFQEVMVGLSKQPWASNLRQIPATVIAEGVLRNVPYLSFRCGDDYEVNIYGDLARPAAIEAGVYRKLLGDANARSNCIRFVQTILGRTSDRLLVQGLDDRADLKTQDGLSFEITPPTAPDAYGGWWISMYSEVELNKARARDSDLEQITVSRQESSSVWSTNELAIARPARPQTITVKTSSGSVFTNAEIVSVNEGVSLIWRVPGAVGGGVIKLGELSKDLQALFGYDPVKAEVAERAEKERRQSGLRQRPPASPLRPDLTSINSRVSVTYNVTSVSSSRTSSPGSSGRVYVRAYTRKDGTYVAAHTRRPRRR